MKLSKHILPLFLLLSATFTVAGQQKGVVSGQLSDTTTHQQLKDAFITIYHTNDSSVQKTIFSTEDGHFVGAQLPMGNYYLKINFQGFATLNVPFVLDKPQLNLGTLYMQNKVKTLDTVIVQEPAIIVKKDTTEYNASRFKTRDYASLADLITLLPGIRLNNDGSITINGQQVNQIMVNGKPFFDGSLQIALEHLPADIIKKIQVFASKSRLPTLPGFPGNKTLNIILRADKKKGDFGKITAGAGTGKTYTASVDLNHMNGAQQTSLIGEAANITSEKSSTTNGIPRQLNAGINYRDSRNDKLSINGSARVNDMRNETNQRTNLINIYSGDSSTITDKNVQAVSNSTIQTATATIEYRPGTQDLFSIQPRLSLQRGNTTSTQNGVQQYQSSGDTIYTTNGNSSSSNNNTAASSQLLYTHDWKKPGQTLAVGVNMGSNTNHYSVTAYTQTNAQETNQHNTNAQKTLNISPSVTYTMPLGDKSILNIQGNYQYNRDAMSYRVYGGKNLDVADTSQSNDYTSTYQTTTLEMSVSRQWNHISLQAGSGVEADWILGNNQTEHAQTSRHFINALPTAMLSFNFEKNRSVMVSYSGKPVTISVQELQPISVTSDSLYITEGNPDLAQPYIHTMGITYTAIINNSRTFSASFTTNSTLHSIQQSVTLMDNGAQISKPVNINGAKDYNFQLNYSIPALNSKSGYSISTNSSYSKTPVLSNGVRNDSRIYNISAGFSYSYTQKEGLGISLSATPGYNAIQTEGGTNNQYFTTYLNTSLSYYRGDWSGLLTASYTYNSSLPTAYRQKYPLAVPSVSYRFLKHKEAAIKLSVLDVFNQQSGISRNITASAIANTWTQARGRYFLGTITYNFRKFK